jgi:hypothetical protein
VEDDYNNCEIPPPRQEPSDLKEMTVLQALDDLGGLQALIVE